MHGIFFLQIALEGGGVVLDTYVDGPAPADEAGWAPVTNYALALLLGLRR